MPIYKVSMEEARWGAVFPGDEWSIPMIDAYFLCFTSKPVHISPNLLYTIDRQQPDVATLTLPFADSLITIGTTMHGGAIASLIDTAAMVAAWSDDSEPDNMRGTTVSLTVIYLATAEHEDIQATARVLRRGRNLVYLDVEVQSLSGKSVARGLVTYKLG
jgi:uncharacterized protein (TIGR00369 family)